MEVRSILILGDSLSKGVVYDREKQRYCYAKDSFVKTMQNFLCPTVHNKAKFGATIEYGSSLLVPKMREIDPQVVLIEFGGNDCDFDWNAIAENPFADHRPKTEIPVFEAHLTQMIEQVRDFGKVPVLMNLPPLNAPAYFRWFTQGDAKKA
ncbi:MAG: SGNH/GDSL hydrolase family protein, partial [Christensenellaceae bacterium]|nr:SGNH/GDSL hydrolase family protein [Christensenellaceae bacterium]